jgi:hypothetical protein
MTRYTYNTYMSIGPDELGEYQEIDAVVSYAVLPAEPETGPSYACGGTPAIDAQVEDLEVDKINGVPITPEDAGLVATILAMFDTAEANARLLSEAAENDAYMWENRR